MTSLSRRTALLAGACTALAPTRGRTQAADRRFEPRPGTRRRFELSTTVDLLGVAGPARVWVPLPSVDAPYQRTLDTSHTGNASQARVVSDRIYGARMLLAEFDGSAGQPQITVTSRVETQDRAVDWKAGGAPREDAASLRTWLKPTELMPTDGIVAETARDITRGLRHDVDKNRAIYEWIVHNTWREPKVRGCGIGDIKAMLETRNLGGKCADLNALFVGLNRAAGVPARDVYGIRLAPSAFGYRELGGNSASLKGVQHCRAEVYLQAHGWVAMDPADVAKVMRQETGEWIKDPQHPLVKPVRAGLFGGWEGNWLAYNTAHDVALPGSQGPKLGFLMYPQAEAGGARLDALAPDDFKYSISARELPRA